MLKIKITGVSMSGKSHLATILYHLLSEYNYNIKVWDDDEWLTDFYKQNLELPNKEDQFPMDLEIEIQEAANN